MTDEGLRRYSVRYKVLQAVQFGSGQARKRLILLASMKGYPILELPYVS